MAAFSQRAGFLVVAHASGTSAVGPPARGIHLSIAPTGAVSGSLSRLAPVRGGIRTTSGVRTSLEPDSSRGSVAVLDRVRGSVEETS